MKKHLLLLLLPLALFIGSCGKDESEQNTAAKLKGTWQSVFTIQELWKDEVKVTEDERNFGLYPQNFVFDGKSKVTIESYVPTPELLYEIKKEGSNEYLVLKYKDGRIWANYNIRNISKTKLIFVSSEHTQEPFEFILPNGEKAVFNKIKNVDEYHKQ